MHPKRIVLVSALGIAGALVGVDFSLTDSSVTSAAGSAGLPLRVEFSLAERAHAAPAMAAPQTRSAGEGPVRLRMALAMRNVPATERPAAADDATGAPPANGPVRLDLLARARDLGDATNTFAAASWVAPPPPPPPPPQSDEPPRAPPLPYRFMGNLDDGAGGNTFFLIRGTETISVSVGQTLDNTYLVERAENGLLHFVYLPLRQAQTLPIGPGS